jgi:Carboxypeptidase regulatory-like domain
MKIHALKIPSIHVSSLVLALAISTVTALAGTSGGVGGMITDANTGKPVSGASVIAHSASQELTTTTDARGHFMFFALQPDSYSITIQKGGYVAQSSDGYEVEADQTQLYDFKITAETPNNQ